jgi:hypothetical protein
MTKFATFKGLLINVAHIVSVENGNTTQGGQYVNTRVYVVGRAEPIMVQDTPADVVLEITRAARRND